MEHFDTIILGAGAAGLFAAGSLIEAAPGHRVLVIDHAEAPAEKIRISGGGRCNFTNMATSRERFVSENPRFSASALAGFRPADFVALVDRAGIAWHEKTQGQLFCDGKATQITAMLLRRAGGSELRLSTSVERVERYADGFRLQSSGGTLSARALVVATGGKSIPKMGATGFAYDLARQFGLGLVETRAGLVPLTFAEQDLALCKPLAGISLPAEIKAGKTRFLDDLLLTHRGLSGPAILQISNYWQPGQALNVDLAPGHDLTADLRSQRDINGRQSVSRALSNALPARLADNIVSGLNLGEARVADLSNAVLTRLAERIHRWTIKPVGTEGYRTAEVTLGGVSTADLDAKTLGARDVPGLYFIGECVDVTGWLGGYNFQWAWASGHACAKAIAGTK